MKYPALTHLVTRSVSTCLFIVTGAAAWAVNWWVSTPAFVAAFVVEHVSDRARDQIAPT